MESEWGLNDAIYAIYFPLFFPEQPERRRLGRKKAAKILRVAGKHETTGSVEEQGKLNRDAFGLFVPR